MTSLCSWSRKLFCLFFCYGALMASAHSLYAAGYDRPLWQEPAPSSSAKVSPGLEIFMTLAEKLAPAVVNISAMHKERVPQRGFPRFRSPFHERDPFGRDPFHEFFERFFGEAPPKAQQSLGSGFIIHPSGLILTNNHVIEGAEKIKVILRDEREFEARVIGRDPKTDIALIQVQADTPLPTVPLGDSDALRIGEWVMAIGNPFGLSHTVTAGIVSAKGRVIGAGQYDDFIQTDASINPGNSGGPLFNTRGEVIGINTAIIAGGTGIGFAIPINLAKELIPQLYEKGKVTRGWLGVMIQKVTPELASALKLKESHGALVTDVMEGSPAAQGGLQRGDVIVAFDGITIREMHQLPRVVANTPVGKQVQIRVLRHGQMKTLTVTIAELRETARPEADDLSHQLGLKVQDLTPKLAQRLGLSITEGVIVTEVRKESVAADAGIRRGDVILEVNRQPVRNRQEYEEALRKGTEDAVLLLIAREETTRYVALQRPPD